MLSHTSGRDTLWLPLAQVARVARFLRIDASADLLARVVEKSSFHFMAAAENQAHIDGDRTSTSILASNLKS